LKGVEKSAPFLLSLHIPNQFTSRILLHLVTMRKLFILCLILSVCNGGLRAQNPTYQQKLYYTCKIWGFVKYFHSGVSNCQVNWDSILVARLPAIKNAVTNTDFNNALDTLLNAAGPMAIVPGVLPDTISPLLKRNRNFSWINDTLLRADVRVILDTIRNNFRPHLGCWVQVNYTSNYYGYLIFPHDSLEVNVNSFVNYPDEWHRLLISFKHWNIINYFNPYNYVLDKPWDSTLYNFVIPIANAPDYITFYRTVKKIASTLSSAHVEGLTNDSWFFCPDIYSPNLVLRYADSKYIVANSGIPVIKRGDAIVSIDGLTPTNWEDSLRPYISAGNVNVFRRYMCQYMPSGGYGSTATIVYSDSIGNNHTFYASRLMGFGNFSFYPNDTLATVHWKQFGCGVGYVNMGNMLPAEVSTMYSTLRNSPAIIFDIRNYPYTNSTINIANAVFPNSMNIAKLSDPDVTYPGTFYWYNEQGGSNGNSSPYHGKIIILMNEETQSAAEFSCMVLGALPNTVKVGSQTAGADGVISFFKLTQDIQTGFTSTGVYYPNGDSTERIGIRPDSVVYPTQLGIRHHRDEVLEKALQIAQCVTGVQNLNDLKPEITVFPNPNSGKFSLSVKNAGLSKVNYRIYSLPGKLIEDKQGLPVPDNSSVELDLSNFDAGIYFLSVQIGELSQTFKIVLVK
jgi:carboxyl-terminal processing protease